MSEQQNNATRLPTIPGTATRAFVRGARMVNGPGKPSCQQQLLPHTRQDGKWSECQFLPRFHGSPPALHENEKHFTACQRLFQTRADIGLEGCFLAGGRSTVK